MVLEPRKKEAASEERTPPFRTNGSVSSPALVRNERVPPAGARQIRLAQSFAQVVAVLMRDPGYQSLRVTDLEWLVLPPLMAGQFRLAHATRRTDPGEVKQGGILMPVAAALWARVSPQVDKALSETADKPVRLSVGAWTSGDILWLMAVAGDRRATPAFLKQLQANDFKGKQVKMRLRSPDGKLTIEDLKVGQSA
jgi:cytolysin-activating lysine-acyltransferase